MVLAVALAAACSSSSSQQQQPGQKLELVDAPATQGDVAPLIAKEVARAEHDGRKLVVYVGAAWCEPCRDFHAAAEAGRLDAKFGDLRMLVFDEDRDGPQLVSAGYEYRMIPMFAVPKPDGTATGRHIEGSVKGADAAQEISPRLAALVAGS